ncbi:MAG TPA: winged helix DNA-binding domain-containing protein [Draconibacterium sp.]|nr:winged helix DNA-binding domain-containing protein [Draconibacterium sp.]
MNLKDISNTRLINQRITGTKFNSVKEVVSWMGAMQAQDFYMSQWAVGVRMSDASESTINSAIDNAEIIRTHALRPTWHFVSPDDIYWMLDLSAPRIKTAMKSRDRELGLTESIFKKSNKILLTILAGDNHLTRAEIISEFQRERIPVDDNRASHLFVRAEIDKIICSGKLKGKKQTYALLSERVKNPKVLNRDEALAELAKRYFTSHGPTTLHDFNWWSGLNITETKQALEMVKSNLSSETVGDHTYWFANFQPEPVIENNEVYLLPAFDEFLISYKDRSASLTFDDHKKAVSNNGMFWPVIVQNGSVIGIWKRIINKDKVALETVFFKKVNKTTKRSIEKAFSSYGDFINKKTLKIH